MKYIDEVSSFGFFFLLWKWHITIHCRCLCFVTFLLSFFFTFLWTLYARLSYSEHSYWCHWIMLNILYILYSQVSSLTTKLMLFFDCLFEHMNREWREEYSDSKENVRNYFTLEPSIHLKYSMATSMETSKSNTHTTQHIPMYFKYRIICLTLVVCVPV